MLTQFVSAYSTRVSNRAVYITSTFNRAI